MTYWSELFQEWQDMQQSYVKNLSLLPDFTYTRKNLNPWELPHLQTFMTWGQSAVKQSMELQVHWLDQWSSQMGHTVEASTKSKEELVIRIQESMTAWADNQAELWQYWFKMIDETTDVMEDSDSLNEHIGYWKSTVDESLKSQTEWLDRWSKEINVKDLTPNELIALSGSIQETMEGWLDLQNELWNQWFKFLRLSESERAQTPAPKVKKTPSPSKPKAKQKPKPVVTPVEEAVAAVTEEVKDNLQTINGIGPALAKKLYQQGITSFKQIADLTEDQIDKLEKTIIRFPGRIRRENWVSQAIDLLKG